MKLSDTISNGFRQTLLGVAALAVFAFSSAHAQSVNVNKGFSPNLVNPGQVTTMTISAFNSSSSAITGAALTDFFTDNGLSGGGRTTNGLIIANPPNVTRSASCGAATVVTAPANATSIAISNATIPAKVGSNDGVCTITVDVFSRLQAANTNIIPAGALSATQAGITNTNAQATLNVLTASAPGFSKSLNPSTLNTGQNSTLSIVIANTGGGAIPLTNYSFTDTLPLGMNTTAAIGRSAGCVGGTVTPGSMTAATAVVASGISVAVGATCTITVPVTSNTPGLFTNQIPAGDMTTNQFANPATVQAPVRFQGLLATKQFTTQNTNTDIPTAILNQVFDLRLVFTTGSQAINNLSFADAFPAGLTLATGGTPAGPLVSNSCGAGTFSPALAAGGTNLNYAGGTLAANVTGGTNTCEIRVRVTGVNTTPSTKTNTIPAASITGDGGIVAEADATDAVDITSVSNGVNVLAITKFFSPTTIPAGGTTRLTINIATNNPAANDLPLTGINVTDTLPTGMTVANPAALSTSPSCSFAGQPAPTVTATSGAGVVTISNASINAPATICTVAVDVVVGNNASYVNNIPTAAITATAPSGTKTDSSGAPDATVNTNSGLTVTKAFAPTSAAPGSTVKLTFTVTNSTATALTDFAINDVLPTGTQALQVAATPAMGITGTGCAATFNATPGNGTTGITAGNIPAGTATTPFVCTFSVDLLVPGGSTATSNNSVPVANITNAEGRTVSASVTANLTKTTSLIVSKSFAPSTIAPGNTSRLTISYQNLTNQPITGFNLTDSLPSGANDSLLVATSPNVSALTPATCLGTVTAAGGTGSVGVSGGTIPASTTCSFQLDVFVPLGSTNASANSIPVANVSNVQSIASSGPANATLGKINSLVIAKSFSPSSVAIGGESTLTVTITNNVTTALTNFSVTDTLPSGANNTLQIAPTPATTGLTGTGCSGTPTATGGGSSVSLTGATIPAAPSTNTPAVCTFTVRVRVPAGSTATSTNTIPAGGVTATTQGQTISNAAPATANLTKTTGVTVSKSFNPTTIPTGGISKLTVTIINNSAVSLTNLALTDGLPSGANDSLLIAPTPAITGLTGTGCTGTPTATAGGSSIVLSGATISAGSTCTFTVDVRAPSTSTATSTNTIPAGGVTNNEGISNLAPATATLSKTPGLTLVKSFNPTTIAAGGLSKLTISITNNSAAPLTNFAVTDSLPNGASDALVIASPPNIVGLTGAAGCTGTPTATGGGSSIALAGATIPTGGTCTFTVDVRAPGGSVNPSVNTIPTGAVTNAEGISNLAPVTATLIKTTALTVAKSFFPTTVPVGGISTVTITITNNIVGTPLTGFNITDPLPTTPADTALIVAPNPNITGLTNGANTTGCTGIPTAIAGSSTFSLTSATIPGATNATTPAICRLSVDVRVPATSTATTSVNTIPTANITNDQAVAASGPATATLTKTSGVTVAKSFFPTTIAVGGVSRLTINVTNNTAASLTGVGLTDTLPVGATDTLQIAPTPAITGLTGAGCAGTPTATAGGPSVSLAGATITAGSTCTFAVDVRAPGGSTATSTNTILAGGVTNNEGISNLAPATATLSKTTALTVAKTFNPTTVPVGGISTVTITITNNIVGTPLTGFNLSDPLPTGGNSALIVAPTPNITGLTNGANTTGCTGAPTAVAGASTFGLTGVTIPGATNASTPAICRFTVDVRAPSSSTATSSNTIPASNVTNDQGITNVAASNTVTLAKTVPVTIAKTFTPTSIAVGGRSRVRITLTNNAFQTQLNNVSVTDPLPATPATARLEVANPPNVAIDASCGTNATVTAVPGAANATLNAAIVLAPLTQGASTTCFYEFDVTAPSGSTASSTNTIPAGAVTNTENLTNAAPATATLTRTSATIIASKGFSPKNVTGGLPSTMTIQLQNNTSTAFTGVTFTDNFPAGMIVYSPPGFATTCPAGTTTAAANATSAFFSGIRVNANGSCNVTLQVTTTRSGNFPNVIAAGVITSFEGFATTQSVSDTLTSLAGVGLTKTFTPETIEPGQTSQLSINITNVDDPGSGAPITNVGVTDNLPANVVVASPSGASASASCGAGTVNAALGAGIVGLSGGTIQPGAVCTVTVNVTSTVAGVYLNTIQKTQVTNTQNLQPPQEASAQLTVAARPTITKAFSPTTIIINASSRLTITLGNTNPAAIAVTLTSALTDTLPSGVVVAGSPNVGGTCITAPGNTVASVTAAAAANTVVFANGSSIPAGGCTITVDVTGSTAGSYVNTIPAGGLGTTVGTNPNPATATLTITPPNASLAGRVYLDVDNDGTFNAGDGGIGSQIVQLVDSGGTVVQTATTVADGTYSFASVPPGTYTVRQPNQPANTINNGTNVGTGATAPGTATAVNVVPSQITGVQLAAGNAAINYSFGEVTPASLAGRVYLDVGNDGVFNGSDTGIGTQTIELLDSGGAVVQTVTTAADGTYSFTNIRPGTGYTVRQPNQPANTLNNVTNVGTGAPAPGTASSVSVTPSTVSGIALNPGSAGINYNFGEVIPASLSGRVYSDIDRNGVFSAPDTGIGTQTIQLVDSGGTVVQTAATAADGTYSLTNIRPGAGYTVRQPNQPANSSDAATNIGTGAVTSGTATAVGVNNPDQISGISLAPGNGAVNYNFGETLAQLAGRVYLDVNNNGTFDGGDSGIAGQTVELRDSTGATLVQTVTTAADGSYIFTNRAPATYTVRQPNQPTGTINNVTNVGTGATAPGTATAVAITPSQFAGVQVAVSDNAINYNFGEVTPASLTGRVWNDLNNDGTFQSGEALNAQTIQLVDSGGTVVQTVITVADGTYSFTNIRPGTYIVRQPNQPAGTVDGPTNPGTGASIAGTGTLVGVNNPDQIAGVTLVPGSTAVNYNFLEFTPASLSGVVYAENDGNTLLSAGDSRLPGVTVNLVQGVTVVATTTTDGNGAYSFTNVLPGTYNVVEPTQPAGTTNATTNAGTGANVSGTATVIGTTPSAINGVGLLPGNNAVSYNFGETFVAGISGVVYRDNNDNGAIDGGLESGIAGIRVELTGITTTNQPVSLFVLTNSSGGYSFDNLAPGTYTVTERGRTAAENQHPDFFNGKVTPGVAGAVTNGTPSAQTVVPSTITGIVLGTVTSGAGLNNSSRNNNFGEIPKSSLSGKVFETFNNDNLQTGSEPPLGGADITTITLSYTDFNGRTIVKTTTTAAGNVAAGATTNTISINGGAPTTTTCSSAPALTAGQYYFCDILPAQTGTTYTVTETQPAGFSSNPASTAAGTSGGDTALNNVVGGISFTPGTNATGYDFAEYRPVTISGVVFAERNGTPNFQVGSDDPIQGASVSLRDSSGNPISGVPDQTTPASGAYSFTNLPPGSYQVVEPTQPAGTINDATFAGTVVGGQTSGSNGGTASAITTTPSSVTNIVAQSGNTISNVNFGEKYNGQISGVVFEDTNDNGVQDAGELPISGVRVELSGTDASGNPVTRAPVATLADGSYIFDQLPPGTYTITEKGRNTNPTENQLPNYGDGKATPGTTGAVTNGTPSAQGTPPSTISGIVLGNTPATNTSVQNNFGELTADLELGKTVDNAAPSIGETVKFSLTVTNKGLATATGVSVQDVLPAGFTFVSSNPAAGVTVAGQTVDWVAGSIASGATSSLEITATVNANQSPAAYINAVQITGSDIKDPDSTPSNGTGNTEDDRASVTVTPRGNINGTIFKDENGNGVQDALEAPIPNVNVVITPSGGGTPFTVVTNASGVFDTSTLSTPGVPAGTYSVAIDESTLPTDYRNQSAGTNPTPVTVGIGENKKEEDNGYRPTGTVTGSVFVDSNGNGVRDAGEPGIPGAPVTVSRPNVPGATPFAPVTVVTDANGDYTVNSVPTGGAVVMVADGDPALSGFTRVPNDATANPGGNNPTPITVVTGNNNAGDDPFRNEGGVKERVFQDTNGNGVQDAGEPGIQGVTVSVTDAGGKVLIGVTDANGDVTISGLLAGPATVTVIETTLPAGLTAQTAGVNPSTVQVVSGQTADAGFDGYQPRGVLTGLVWRDDNGDGIKDPTEVLFPNVTVTITDQFGKVMVVQTDANGQYSAPVASGPVTVVHTTPDNTRLTTSNDNQTVIVPTGGSVKADDVGYQPLAGGLTGTVFNDINANGIKDPGELGIPGATVTITDDKGKVVTLVTDANGNYTTGSTDLAFGPAKVVVTPPPGYVVTTDNLTQTVNVPAGSIGRVPDVGLVKPSIVLEKNVVQAGMVIPRTQTPAVNLGGNLEYQISLTNSGAIAVRGVTITDTLPAGLQYLTGTSKLEGTAIADPAITVVAGKQVLTWSFPANQLLAPGAVSKLRFITVVTPETRGDQLINTAVARAVTGPTGSTIVVASNASTAAVKVELGVFSFKTVITGRVYFDVNDNDSFEVDSDSPLFGARVYLSDGRSAVTDNLGRYSIPDIEPGVYTVRLDPVTAPYTVKSTPDMQGAPGSRYVRASSDGGITQEDFLLVKPSAVGVKSRSTVVQRGAVTLTKAITQGGAGYAVTMTITVNAAVRNLAITDPLPANSDRGPVTGATLEGNALRFAGVTQPGTYTVTYALFTAAPPDLVLTDPDINYEQIFTLIPSSPVGVTKAQISDEVIR